MMKVSDFLTMIHKAVNTQSLYVMGGWGYPLGYSNNRDRTQSNSYNRRPERKGKIYKAADNVFAWDCCGLCKGVVWGWTGDTTKKNGGATYASNGLPDWDAKEIMFKGTTEQSTDFSKIEAGEFLWRDGHCGVYIGDGLAAESTPSWKDGAQITAVANIGPKTGYQSRLWTHHGHLKCIEYEPSKYPATPFEAVNILKGVSIRETPYSDGQIIGTIKQGCTIKVESLEGSSDDFAKITGYVYLPGGFAWEKSIDGYVVGQTYTVTCSELNVRTKAEVSDSALVVTTLSKGAKVTCKALTRDADGNTWMRIDSPSGWIAAKYNGDKYVV